MTRLIIDSYVPIPPSKFKVGDIVEVKVSFTAIQTRTEDFKIMCVLRALTLLDGTFTQVSRYI